MGEEQEQEELETYRKVKVIIELLLIRITKNKRSKYTLYKIESQ